MCLTAVHEIVLDSLSAAFTGLRRQVCGWALRALAAPFQHRPLNPVDLSSASVRHCPGRFIGAHYRELPHIR
jgi:hypothetical protein